MQQSFLFLANARHKNNQTPLTPYYTVDEMNRRSRTDW
jgi:hypothetical protein